MYFPEMYGKATRKRKPENDLPVQIVQKGFLLQVHAGKAYEPPPCRQKGAKIKHFSRAARLRLTKNLLTVDYGKTPVSVLITLTYPDALVPRTKDQRAIDLSQFLRRIEKHLGRQVYGVWRVEWEARKTGEHRGNIAPHIHLLLFGVVFIHYRNINVWWRRILRYSRACRTEIKRAGKVRSTLRYLGKYIKKAGEASLVYAPNYNSMDGKHYGYVRPKSIPRCKTTWISKPTEAQLEYLFKMHHELWPDSDTRMGESFSIMAEGAERIMQICREIGLTNPPSTS